MTSRITQIIDEMQAYIESCKFQPFSTSKIVVDKEEIDDLIRELRQRTPEEIQRYQKIITQRDVIMEDAKKKAKELIEAATIQTNELISEHEIMQQAYAQANEVVSMATQKAQEMLDNATIEANNMKAAALQYTDDILGKLEDILSHSIDNNTRHFEETLYSLKECENIVKSNRMELHPNDIIDDSFSDDTTELTDTDGIVLDLL